MKKETLLEKAKKVPVLKRRTIDITDEKKELAFAWLKGEITITQASKAFGANRVSGNILYLFAVIFRDAYKNGKIVLKL